MRYNLSSKCVSGRTHRLFTLYSRVRLTCSVQYAFGAYPLLFTSMNVTLLQLRFLLLITVLFLVGCGSRHPSDQVLEQRLRLREDECERLVAMLARDSDVMRLSDDFVFMSEGSRRSLSEERLSEYCRLFRELELEAGMHRDGANAVRLIASSKGLLMANSEKSYLYSSVEPSPLVESLDTVIRKDGGDQAPVYKRVSGNWYLYYESW